MNVSEIGFSPGKNASSVRAFDNVETRKGYSGLYQFGAAYNPETFNNSVERPLHDPEIICCTGWPPGSLAHRSPEAKGLDATFALDWSPADVNRNNRLLTAGLRFNEPLPLPIHNTISFGYVQNSLSSQFLSAGAPAWKDERGFEINSLFLIRCCSSSQWSSITTTREAGLVSAVVVGFRTKLEL